MKYGYIESKRTPEHYILGGSPMPFKEYRKDGDWSLSRPAKELQRIGFETYNCTSFNTLAQIEAFMDEVYGLKVNYSDRWLGIVAGTRPPGNDPQTVYEAIRKYGLIPEEMLPFSYDLENVDEYYSFKGADMEACYRAGREWLEKWEFMHEWVVGDGNTRDEQIHNMKVALKSSPLARAVYAWKKDERGLYVRGGADNHWCFQYAEDGFSKFEDSYEPTLKLVDQDVLFCKRIYIRRKPAPVKPTLWQRILGWIKNL